MAMESFNGRCRSTSPIIFILIVMLTICNQISYCQENAQTRIPKSLTECYENPEIYERDNRLPATMSTLIELIRKIEDVPEFSSDVRTVVINLVHRFRLDGIEHAQGDWSRNVLPFSPSGYQFSKHRYLLSRLIPGDAIRFPNDTLSAVERVNIADKLQNQKKKKNKQTNKLNIYLLIICWIFSALYIF